MSFGNFLAKDGIFSTKIFIRLKGFLESHHKVHELDWCGKKCWNWKQIKTNLYKYTPIYIHKHK